MEVTTPKGLLSADITAGDTRRIDLEVVNTGSSELKDIQLSSRKPAGWELSFEPSKIASLKAGAAANVKKIGRGYNVQRYKGLGEMNASQLWETTMDPETRTLIQVSIDDAAVVERNVTVLMGDKVEPRREWIEQNVQFTLEDNYQI